MIRASDLDEALKAAGIPILGVAVTSEDRSRWRVDFDPSATQAHRDQAAAMLAVFVEPTAASRLDALAQAETNEKQLQAVAMGLWECIPSPVMTKAQLKNRIVAIYKTL